MESRLHVGDELDNCVRVAREVMDEMDVPADIRRGLEHIIAIIEGGLSKRTAEAVRLGGSDPVGMGELSAAMMLQFGTGRRGKELLENWRKSVRRAEEIQPRHTPEEWVSVAEALAAGNGGVLRNPGWLQKNGYSGLVKAMLDRPELFAHIKQKRGRLTPKEWVLMAEEMALENGGVLQNPWWLIENGRREMVKAMRKFPKLFAHIEQERMRPVCRTPEEWVPVAEGLAAGNGGVLRNSKQLAKNGYGGLVQVMRKFPKLFAHIRQEKRDCRTPEEWVKKAERLANGNGGVLQNPQWLCDNGYKGLVQATKKFPKLFAHIRQKRKVRRKAGCPDDRVPVRHTPEEWVSVAEALAAWNGGVLPGTGRQLAKNGYGGLVQVMRKFPKLFAHIARGS